jgi:hypothetical protein
MDNVQIGPPFSNDAERDRRDKAFDHLRGLLDLKTFGDIISAEEIIDATGFEDWRLFSRRVRRYMDQRGFAILPVPHNGWRVAGAKEQALAVAPRAVERGRKVVARGGRQAAVVPPTELTDREERLRTFFVGKVTSEIALAEKNRGEIRRHLTAGKRTERVPLKLK